MSLIGINITIKESRSAYIQFARVMLFQSASSLENMNLELVKKSMKESIQHIDVWWATKPYIRIKVDTSLMDNMIKMYTITPLTGEQPGTSRLGNLASGLSLKRINTHVIIFLQEMSIATGEGYQRNIRSPDLICDISSVAVIENMFPVAVLLLS